MKTKVLKEGDLCHHCQTPVFLKKSKFHEKKLLKPYYYSAFFQCPYCRAMYMSEEFKIINKAVFEQRQKKKEKRYAKSRPVKRYERLKGLITKEKYALYRESPLWKDKRNKFLQDNPYCFVCEGIATEVHHCNYDRVGREKNKDLVPMCHKDHFATHDYMKANKLLLINAHIIYKQKRAQNLNGKDSL